MTINTAKDCFLENITLFGDAKTNPEKFNLYNGLVNLCTAIQRLGNDVHNMEQDIKRIKQSVEYIQARTK